MRPAHIPETRSNRTPPGQTRPAASALMPTLLQVLPCLMALISFMLVGCTSKPEPTPIPDAEPSVQDLLEKLGVINSVKFAPTHPAAGEDIQAEVKKSALGEQYQLRYEWSKNGELVPTVTGPTFPGALTAAKDVLRLKVIPYDASGDKKSFTTGPLDIVPGNGGQKWGDSHLCEKNSDCASGACGEVLDGRRCVGNSTNSNKDLALSPTMIQNLETETTLSIQGTPKPEPKRKFNSRGSSTTSSGRSSGTNGSKSSGWYGSGQNSSWGASDQGSSRDGLNLGGRCSQVGCGPGLVCKGVSGMEVCVPSGR